jgi:hypothetical protein
MPVCAAATPRSAPFAAALAPRSTFFLASAAKSSAALVLEFGACEGKRFHVTCSLNLRSHDHAGGASVDHDSFDWRAVRQILRLLVDVCQERIVDREIGWFDIRYLVRSSEDRGNLEAIALAPT